jgi:hypothetical protein
MITQKRLRAAQELEDELNRGSLRCEMYSPDIDRKNLYTILNKPGVIRSADGGIYMDDKRYLYEDGSVGIY